MSVVVLLVAGMLMIVLAAGYFTNGVEWLGYRLGLGEGVSGSLLAALGTALPETLVPVMAFVVKGPQGVQDAIGLGAILGAPFMLATLGFSMIGLGVWMSGRRVNGLQIGKDAMAHDLEFFMAAFGLTIITAFLPVRWHQWVGLLLVLGYMYHAWRLLRNRPSSDEGGIPEQHLHFYDSPHPPLAIVILQVAVALFGLIVGAHFFVEALGQVTSRVHISGFLVAVIVTPLATELPEVLNSVIWLRRKKDVLAVGNVTGAMAFQASLVPAIGMFLTTWHFTPWELVTALLAWAASFWTYRRSRDGVLHIAELFSAGLFYLLFIVLVVILA